MKQAYDYVAICRTNVDNELFNFTKEISRSKLKLFLENFFSDAGKFSFEYNGCSKSTPSFYRFSIPKSETVCVLTICVVNHNAHDNKLLTKSLEKGFK